MNSNWLIIVLGLVLLTGCTSEVTSAPESTPNPSAGGVQPVQGLTRLPVSLNTVMVAMVNQAADPLWVAAWHNPETDEDWRALERRAVQLELAGTLLSVPGTGPLDEAWTSETMWQQWSGQLRDVRASAVAAVHARDIEAISNVGDTIVEVCEGCHRDFKLAFPTGGEFGELSPTAEDFEPE